jgi:hypothetical protein
MVPYALTTYSHAVSIYFERSGVLHGPYTREIIFDKSPDKIYEYACHEGNYGMTNILSGHRVLERQAAE